MVWQSTLGMTAIDLTSLVVGVASVTLVLRNRNALAASQALVGFWVVVGGVLVICLFLQADLALRWIVPALRPEADVASLVQALHARYGAVAILVGGLGVVTGAGLVGRGGSRLIAAVETSESGREDELRARHRADAARARGEERLSRALEASGVATWEWTPNDDQVSWSYNAPLVLAVDTDGLGGTMEWFLTLVHDDDRDDVRRILHAAAERGTEVDMEFRLLRPDGALIWLAGKGRAPAGTGTGHPSLLGTFWNITPRKRAAQERESLERQLRHAQRMESLGTLAGGIAHDFNNILTPILGFSEYATLQVDENHPVQESLEQVANAAQRAKELVQQILTFSRGVDQERQAVDTEVVLREAMGLLRASLPTSIEIRERVSDDAEPILADATQFHQVVMNLCMNAAHAMRDGGGMVDVALGPVEVDEDWANLRAGLRPGRYMRLAVSDTGTGMDPETLERVFDPFFTTKPTDEGTGLGLSMVHGIAMSHRGDVAITSEPGVGTTVQVLFPVMDNPKTRDSTLDEPAPEGTGRILFVDDEEGIARLGKRMLERLGYDVTATTDGVAALESFRNDPFAWDAVVTDQTMPRLSGADLASEMMRIRPDLPIILISGFSETMSPALARSLGIREYLMKPFRRHQLGGAVRRALIAPSAQK